MIFALSKQILTGASAPVPRVGTLTRLDPKRLGALGAEASLSWL